MMDNIDNAMQERIKRQEEELMYYHEADNGKPMTNRDRLSYSTNHIIAKAGYFLIWRPALWVDDIDVSYAGTREIENWLNQPYDYNSKFWQYLFREIKAEDELEDNHGEHK